VTVPASSAVTRPEDEMLASGEPPIDQVAVFPVMTEPFEVFATAVPCDVPPMTMLDDDRLTVTDDTTEDEGADAVTLTAMLPVTPEAAAWIVADPVPTAVTRPEPDTVATDEFEVVHVNDVPEIVAPCASFAAAEACVVWPTASELLDGVTAMDATVEVPVT